MKNGKISIIGPLLCLAGILVSVWSCPPAEPAGPSLKVELGSDGFRKWEDNTCACTCREYLEPVKPGYAYEGDTGSGLYYIQPVNAGSPLTVYCDMQNEGGGWTLVLLNSGFATSPTPLWDDALGYNSVTGNMNDGLASGFDQLLGLRYWDC